MHHRGERNVGHDREAERGDDYHRVRILDAPAECVFDALATLDGIRGWWTPLASGSTAVGDEFRLAFAGLDEYIVMHIDISRRPIQVEWTCRKHTSLEEWAGTRMTFTVTAHGERSQLDFHHLGLTPELDCYGRCASGWDAFLGSLAAYVKSGTGRPFG